MKWRRPSRVSPEAHLNQESLLRRKFPYRFSVHTLTLPETEKNNRLDGAELENGIKGRQQVSRGEVEEVESVERQWDGNVVNYCGESSVISPTLDGCVIIVPVM